MNKESGTTGTLFSLFQSMFIEAGGAVHEEREWYYGNKEKERLGPYSLREVITVTLCYFLISFKRISNFLR